MRYRLVRMMACMHVRGMAWHINNAHPGIFSLSLFIASGMHERWTEDFARSLCSPIIDGRRPFYHLAWRWRRMQKLSSRQLLTGIQVSQLSATVTSRGRTRTCRRQKRDKCFPKKNIFIRHTMGPRNRNRDNCTSQGAVSKVAHAILLRLDMMKQFKETYGRPRGC